MPVEYVRTPYEIIEVSNVELIGINEQVAQNEFGGIVAVNVSSEVHQGRIRLITFRMVNEGAGAVIAEAGTLLILRATQAIAVGDTDLSTNEANAIDARVRILAADWSSFPSFAVATRQLDVPYVTDNDGKFHVVWYHRGATMFNSAGGDNERLRANFVIERMT